MNLKDIKFEDLKSYIDLYLELGADYESSFMLALEVVLWEIIILIKLIILERY